MKKIFTFILALLLFHLLTAQEVGTSYVPIVSQSVYFDVSKPLTEIAIPPQGKYAHHQWKDKVVENKFKDKNIKNPDGALPYGEDPIWQKDLGEKGITGPIQNFEGVRNSDNGASTDWVSPPDTDGDVGPNHYFQMCNIIFQIFDKSGTSLLGPLDNSTIWDGFVGAWTGTNDGDPIILYDEQADRWLVSQFAVNTSNGTYWELVAISTTGDPTGSYYRYAFQFTSFPDYPKFGIWRDGYYIMVQHGTAAGNVTAASFNRSQMIAGNATAQMVSFAVPNLPGGGFIGMLPSDNDGDWAPLGSPNYFMYFSDDAWGDDPVDRLKIWEFTVNWTTPALSTLVLTTNLNTTAFDSYFGSFSSGWITQPVTTQKLAVMEGALMNRLQYRNFGTYESMVCCHTVDVNGSNRAGIRWYELRKTSGSWSIYQQGTYSPGTTDNFWMASIAQNGDGDIALGYSVSSTATYPSIRYTGRENGDALGTMTLTEQSIYAGTAYQYGTHRWGDYTMMSVDPTDDKTFWYTNEYITSSTNWSDWVTRIASFSFNDYCAAAGGCDEYISNVTIGSINNSSGCNGFADYTSLSTNLHKSSTALLTITNGVTSYTSDQCGAWVDWNADGDFLDANETITVSGTPGVGPYTATIDPPDGVTLGAKTMRVRITYTGTVSSCGTTTYGEVEDYTINIYGTPGLWTGTVSTAWNTAGNWDDGIVPTSTTAVIIQAGTPFSPVISNGVSANCASLFLNSGSTLTQNSTSYFYCYGTFDAGFGTFTMNGTTSYLYLRGSSNSYWYDDYQDDTYSNVSVWKDNLAATVSLQSNINCNRVLEVFTGTLSLSSTTLTCSSTLSPAFVVRNGAKIILDNSSDAINVAGSVQFDNGSQAVITNGTMRCGGNFTVNSNTSYNIAFTGGTLIMNGSSTQYINDLDGGSLDLYYLEISKTAGVCYIQSANLDVLRNVTITGGSFSANNGPSPTLSYNITLGGEWNNTAGASGFIPGSGTVIFQSLTGDAQDVDGTNTFNNITQVNTGQYLRFNGNTNLLGNLELHNFCWAYQNLTINGILNLNDAASKFTSQGPTGNVTAASLDMGGSLVCNGSDALLTVNDLVDNGLFGKFYVYSTNAVMNINNLLGNLWVDLNGEIHISAGTMNVSGSVSDWTYAGNALVEMSGGVLDFKTCGISVYNNPTYTFTENITGGTIKTAYGFAGNRSEFTPSGGILELYGSSDATISQSNGSTLNNVVINKTAKDLSFAEPTVLGESDKNDNTYNKEGKANSVSLITNVTINGSLNISAGTLNIGAYTCTVASNANVYGALTMTNALGVLNIGTYQYDNLWFWPGSNGNLSAGNIYLKSWIAVDAGSTFAASVGNTIHIIGSNSGGGFGCSEPTAVFGNININKSTTNPSYLASDFSGPYNVLGTFTVQSGNSFQTGNNTLHINGILTDFYTSSIYLNYVYKDQNSSVTSKVVETPPIDDYKSGTKGGYLEMESDLTLNGLMDVGDGNVLLHGRLTINNSGILNITSGSFICDSPNVAADYWHYIDGQLNLTSGLFEITNNSPNFGLSASTNISGGIIRSGEGFNSGLNAGVFDPTGGVVEFTGVVPDGNIYCYTGNWFHDLRINNTSGNTTHYLSDILVKNDVIIDAGALACGYNQAFSLYIGNDFDNNVGSTGYAPGTGTVYFNGTGALNHQIISGNTNFYNIENVKTGSGHLEFNGDIDVTNNFLANGTNLINGPTLDAYNLLLSTGELGLTTGAPNVNVTNFTMGGVLSVTNGNFLCTDVVNNGIFGTISLINGSITLFQDISQFPDLNATVNISGGYMAVNGGNGGSYWGYGAACNITMSNGELDFNGNGIYMDNAKPVTENITGGTIKTDQMFGVANTNFTPAGGTIQLYGGSDSYIQTLNNSNVFNLLINKSGGDKDFSIDNFSLVENKSELKTEQNEFSSSENSDRPKFPVESSKSNTVYTSGILKINGTTTVEEGTLLVDNYTATCMNNIVVNSGGKLAMGDYGTLAIDNGRSLTINNSGILDMQGSSAGAATITHNTGYYAINVESGGTIGALYGTFEYTNTSGVNVKTGALVNNLKPFSNCTFRNGQTGGTLLTVNNNQTFYVENAVFPTNTWTGASNVSKSVNSGMVYFVTASGGFAGESFDNDSFNRIMWSGRFLSLKAYLEGPFNGSTMNTTLNGILPLNHPYNVTLPYFGGTPEWYYTGAGSVAAIPNVNIVDWVLVELRDAVSAATATPATSIAKIPAFILNNGTIVGLNGSTNLDFSTAIVNNLYVVIYNRNHQSIMNAAPVPYATGTYTYDFSLGASQVYGGTAGHKQLASGIWGMRSGDGNGNGDILLNDKTQVWGLPTQAGKTGYLPSDFNFDRQTNNKDKNDKWVPNNGSSSSVPN